MRKVKIFFLVFVLIILLVLVRIFEESLFYDPLLLFFKTDHLTQPLPQFNAFKLLGNVAFRFFINTLISLIMLWVLFRSRSIIKLSAILYSILFILLFAAYMYLIFFSEKGSYMTLFYVRRFLIQPLFLLILIPAFYFQKKMTP